MSNQLFFLSLADIFSVYPNIFKELIAVRAKPTLIYLPSDADWKERMYYRLLEVQKRVNEAASVDSDVEVDYVVERKDIQLFNHLTNVLSLSPISTPNMSPDGILQMQKARKKCMKIHGRRLKDQSQFWNLTTIAIAANLLVHPAKAVKFENEQEMRKVYSLIYDVFRFKVVLSNALNDIGFYDHFPEHKKDENRVWLMFFELLGKDFKQRNSEEIELQNKLFRESNVAEIANHLWQFRKALAASISRMRIKCNALSLSKLLPIHLQNEKVSNAASNTMVTGWMNPFLLRDKAAADKYLTDCGYKLQVNGDNQILEINHYRWDNVCPLFISCVPEDKGEFTKSKLVTQHFFIIQDKAFSYGPAVMSRLLEYFQLSGDILQTHIASPRSTAYLAALFYSVNRVNNFYVYSTGSNFDEYRQFMDDLSISNIRLHAELFTTFPLESKRFSYVVGIFANPPNSFSAISDPIDLICSRGGDLSMLEVLTESEISNEGKRRVSLILEEQLVTLQMAMSRPQIQFILYQTHSIVSAENQDMVNYAVKLVNETSLEKHLSAYREKKRLEALAQAEAANVPAAAMGSPRKRATTNTQTEEKEKVKSAATTERGTTEKVAGTESGTTKSDAQLGEVSGGTGTTFDEDSEASVTLPAIDEFVCADIPDICANQDCCMNKLSTGSYVALIKRKEITQLNAKYLIKMAEARGLFAKAEKSSTPRSKAATIKKQETSNVEATTNESDYERRKKGRKCINVDQLISRLMENTNCSLNRIHLTRVSHHQTNPLRFNFKQRECMRYKASLFKLYQLKSEGANTRLHRCSIELLAETFSNTICCLKRKRDRRKLPYPVHIQNLVISR